MPRLYPKSLNGLLLLHQLTFVALVIVTAALCGMWAYFWQQSSAESLRINSLLFEVQQIRGDVYRQIKEVTRARLLQDPTALDQYWRHLYHIDRRFNNLQQTAVGAAESEAIKPMREAYTFLQTEMNKLFADPSSANEAIRATVLDPAYEEWMLGDFETAFQEFTELIAAQRRSLETSLARWTRLAPIIIPVPIFLAVLLLFFSHRSLQREFVRPMKDVAVSAALISRGEMEHRITPTGAQEVSQIASTINEMTAELKESRDALVESERQAALGALVPVVAHNIRNPLASIRASAQLIDEPDDADDLRETRGAILDTVDRLERWLKSLLSYLHPMQPQLSAQRMTIATEGALKLLEPKIGEKRLEIVRQNWDHDPPLRFDIDLMEQAIYGLINNAIEASPVDGSISLEIANSADRMKLSISDEGPGMRTDPEPTNLTPGPSTKRFGTGLGIPFASKVLHLHGGEISFGEATGGGARVALSLPIDNG